MEYEEKVITINTRVGSRSYLVRVAHDNIDGEECSHIKPCEEMQYDYETTEFEMFFRFGAHCEGFDPERIVTVSGHI